MQGTEKSIKAKWKLFALEYIKDFNPVRAYKECGAYRPRTDRIAQAAASRLLTKDNFSLILQDVMADRVNRLELDADRVLLEQWRIAMHDARNYMEWNEHGELRLKPSKELTEDEASAIAEVRYTTTQTGSSLSLKFHAKQPALESLMKHMDLYAADNKKVLEHVGIAQLPDSIDAESWAVVTPKELANASQNESET